MTSSLLQTIGDTTLVELRNVVPAGSARVLIKLEAENPISRIK